VRPNPGISAEKVFLGNHQLLHTVYMMNPFACFFECFRDVMLWGQPPQLDLLLYVAAVSIVVFIAGFALFTRGEGRFAKYV
jgi:ABC-type polysaccharide/polyol phosphate export permease